MEVKTFYGIKGDEIAEFTGDGKPPEGYIEISELEYTLARLIRRHGSKAIEKAITRLLKLLPPA